MICETAGEEKVCKLLQTTTLFVSALFFLLSSVASQWPNGSAEIGWLLEWRAAGPPVPALEQHLRGGGGGGSLLLLGAARERTTTRRSGEENQTDKDEHTIDLLCGHLLPPFELLLRSQVAWFAAKHSQGNLSSGDNAVLRDTCTATSGQARACDELRARDHCPSGAPPPPPSKRLVVHCSPPSGQKWTSAEPSSGCRPAASERISTTSWQIPTNFAPY